MRSISIKLFDSLKDRLSKVFVNHYDVTLNDIRSSIYVRPWDGFYSQAFCEVLSEWCRAHECRFCFASDVNGIICRVYLDK